MNVGFQDDVIVTIGKYLQQRKRVHHRVIRLYAGQKQSSDQLSNHVCQHLAHSLLKDDRVGHPSPHKKLCI